MSEVLLFLQDLRFTAAMMIMTVVVVSVCFFTSGGNILHYIRFGPIFKIRKPRLEGSNTQVGA